MAASDPTELSDADVAGPAPAAGPSGAPPVAPAGAVTATPDGSAPPNPQKDAVTGSIVPIAGLSEDPRMHGVWRNADGQVAYVGDANAVSPQGNEVSINGSGEPERIASFLKAHPDMATPAPGKGELTDADVVGEPGGGPGAEKTQIEKAADIVSASKPPELRALAEGTAMGFEPEIVGGASYVKTAISNALDELNGKHPAYTADEAGKAMEQSEAAANAKFKAEHPVENAALGIGGSLANPVNLAGGEFIGAAPTVMGALGRGAAVGGVTGALEGAGESGGDMDSRAKGALSGFETGVVGGGILGAGGRALAGAVRPAAANVADNVAAARGALDQVGIGQVPADTQSAINSAVAAGGHPVDSAFRGVAETLPTPVPLSVGQASGEPNLQLAESLALKGAKGQPARQTAAAFREGQQGALQENTRQVARQVAGGQDLEPGEAGANLSHRLNSARDYYKAGVDKAYDAARAAPAADLSPAGIAHTKSTVRAGLEGFDLRNKDLRNVINEVKNIDAALDAAAPAESAQPALPGVTTKKGDAMDLSKFSAAARDKILASTEGATPKSGITPSGNAVKDLFDARQRLTTLAKAYPPTTESTAAGRVKAQLDLAIDHAVKQDLFRGDTAGVQAWKDAIGKRREFGRLFQGNDLIDTLTDRIDRGGERGTLKIPADQATNYILGREGLGGLGDVNRGRDLARLGDILGRTSPQWQGIKGEIIGRIFAAGDKTAPGGGTELSGAKLATAWNRAQSKYPGVINGMFTQSERDLISRLVTTAHRATEPVPGGINRSDTFTGIASMMHKVGPGVVQALTHIPGVNLAVEAAKDAAASQAIRRATFGAAARPAAHTAESILRGSAGRPPSAFAGIAAQQGTSALEQLPGPRH